MTTRTRQRINGSAARSTKRPEGVAIYTRLSLDKTGEGAAVERQETDCRLLGKAKDWPEPIPYCDNSKSATDVDVTRDEFEKLIVDIEAGRIQAIICWHLDRLVRRMADLVRLIEAGQKYGLNIATVHGVSLDLGDPTGVAVAQILCAIAEMEARHKGERQTRANEQRALDGKQSATRCFGYNHKGKVRAAEAVHVRKVFEMFASGTSVSALARYLTDTGMPSTIGKKNGGIWSRRGVIAILENRRYIGEVWYRGERVMKKGNWKPLVKRDLFDRCAAILADPTRKTTTGPHRQYLGPSLYRCGTCAAEGRDEFVASAVCSTTRRSDGLRTKYTYLICQKHLVRPALHLRVRMDRVDLYVKDEIVSYLNGPKFKASFAADRKVARAKELGDKLAAIEAKERLFADDQVSDDPNYSALQVKHMTAKLHERARKIRNELAELRRDSILAKLAGETNPGHAWLELDVFQAAEAVEGLAVITVDQMPPAQFVAQDAVTINWIE